MMTSFFPASSPKVAPPPSPVSKSGSGSAPSSSTPGGLDLSDSETKGYLDMYRSSFASVAPGK